MKIHNFVTDNKEDFRTVTLLMAILMNNFDEYGGNLSECEGDIFVRVHDVDTKRGPMVEMIVQVGLDEWTAVRKSAKNAANAIIAKMVGNVTVEW